MRLREPNKFQHLSQYLRNKTFTCFHKGKHEHSGLDKLILSREVHTDTTILLFQRDIRCQLEWI